MTEDEKGVIDDTSPLDAHDDEDGTRTIPELREFNMEFWGRLEETDPRVTKKQTSGAKLTSSNGVYQFKKMTEVFGPCGIGWGFETQSSEFIDTGPILDSRPNEQGQPVVLDNGKLHTLRIKLWYIDPTISERCEIEGIGHTPFKYGAGGGERNGVITPRYVMADMEYEKKSLTDAITNAMAKLGMSADVRMGMFDDGDYVKGLYDEIAIDEAEDKEAEVAQQRHDFEDWYGSHMELLGTCATIRELEILYKGARPRVERQGTPDEQKAHKETKDLRFRELKDLGSGRKKEGEDG